MHRLKKLNLNLSLHKIH